MKYPILYEQNETDFFNLGLGPLTNTLKAHVVEERNGAFYLDMEVLVNSEKYPLLQENRIIKVDAGHILKDQRFRIKKIVPTENNKAEVYAEHVSYLAEELSLKPEAGATGTADSAIKAWKANIIDKNEFVVNSDITTMSNTTWKINEVQNAREALGGVKGSILDRWGGEYRFDNYHISLLKKRGKTAETLLAYGRNITDFEQERNIKNTYNAVYPFVVYREEDKDDDIIFTLKDYIVDSKHVNNYPNRKALPVDFSSEFKDGEKPTAEKLQRLADRYIVDNDIGVPNVSIKLKFVDLSKTLDYEELAPLEQLNLCDDVRIIYPKLGVDTVSKVIRVVWDHLTESYYEIEIGQRRLTLSNVIRDQEKAINEIHTETNYAILSANGKNTNFYGLYGVDGLGEPKATRVDDTWFKPNGEHTEMYRWGGFKWVFIFSTAPDNSIIEKIEELEQVSKDSQEKADQAIEDAGFSKIEVEKIKKEVTEISEITIETDKKSDKALEEAAASRQTANEAKQQSFNSEQLANSAKNDAALAIAKGDENSTQIVNIQGEQKLTNIKVEGNTASIMSLESNADKFSLALGKVQSDVDGISVGGRNYLLKTAEPKVVTGAVGAKSYYLYSFTTKTLSSFCGDTYGEPVLIAYKWKFITGEKTGSFQVQFNGQPYGTGNATKVIVSENNTSGFVVTKTTSKENWDTLTSSISLRTDDLLCSIEISEMRLLKSNTLYDWSLPPEENLSKSEFATFEANYKGFQFDVNNDFTGLHSQQTQTDSQISSIVGDLEKKITNKQFKLSDTGADNNNKWTKIASTKLERRYSSAQFVADITAGGSAYRYGQKVQIYVRHKQQEVLGGDTYTNISVYNESTDIKADDFVACVLEKNDKYVYVEYYMRVKIKHERITINPFNEEGVQAVYYPNQPFLTSLPGFDKSFGEASGNLALGNKNSSEIIQLSDQITQTVKKVETVDGRVTQQQTEIVQLSGQISQTAQKTEIIDGVLTEQQGQLNVMSNEINQTVKELEKKKDDKQFRTKATTTVGNWTKIASTTATAQGQVNQFVADIIVDGADGQLAQLLVKHTQNNNLSNSPSDLKLELYSEAEKLPATDIKAVNTVKDGTKVVIEYWVRLDNNFLFINPYTESGTGIEYFNEHALFADYPNGRVYNCKESGNLQRLKGAESSIVQLSNSITQTVTNITEIEDGMLQHQTQIKQLENSISSTVTRIEEVDDKVVKQQTQITQMDNRITQVVQEQTELNTKYSKIEQTTDAIRSEVVEIGQAVADIGTYVNYLINADSFSNSLPYTLGMAKPTLYNVGADMTSGVLKLTQTSPSSGEYTITDGVSELAGGTEYTLSGYFRRYNLDLELCIRSISSMTPIKSMKLSLTADFEFTFTLPYGKYFVYFKTLGNSAGQYSYLEKLKINKGSKRIENTVDTASLNARISNVEQTADGIKTEVAVIKNDQVIQSSEITQLSNNINLRVEKDKVISQINISPETIRIQSKLIHLSGQSLIDNAVIKNAMIDSMTANKLTAGIIDATQIKVINMDANNIVTGTLKAIDITGSTITGSTFTTSGSGTITKIENGNLSILSNAGKLLGSFTAAKHLNNRDALALDLGLDSKFFYINHYNSEGAILLTNKSETEIPSGFSKDNQITFFGYTQFLNGIVPSGWGTLGGEPIRITHTIGMPGNNKTGILNDYGTSGVTFDRNNAYIFHNGKEISFSEVIRKLAYVNK